MATSLACVGDSVPLVQRALFGQTDTLDLMAVTSRVETGKQVIMGLH